MEGQDLNAVIYVFAGRCNARAPLVISADIDSPSFCNLKNLTVFGISVSIFHLSDQRPSSSLLMVYKQLLIICSLSSYLTPQLSITTCRDTESNIYPISFECM